MYQNLKKILIVLALPALCSSCSLLRESSKYNFNDGIYKTSRFQNKKVYVMHVDDDSIAVFPVKEFKDSTAIMTKERVNYTTVQRKFKDKKTSHTFYKPSTDFDVMTMPLKYRFAENGIPNQINTNFNGALFGGYRIDEYKLKYKRTPINTYKQTTRHKGYSAGLFLGIGSSPISQWVMTDPRFPLEYDGVTLLTGVAFNVSLDKVNFGISIGFDHLLDKYHTEWIYQGKPCIGFTVGLDLD